MSATVIKQWCESRKIIPEDEDEPFVLDYYVHADTMNYEEQDLKVVISTQRLLKLVSKSDMVQAHGTYKLVWQGYPVIILGTTDKQHVFHPFAHAVCKDESSDDFAFVFRAVRAFNVEWTPSILLADGSEAITRVFTDVFGAPRVRLMCFFHVVHNIEKYMKPLKSKVSGQIRCDLRALQTAKDEITFTIASRLFLQKCKKEYPDFFKYFEEQWLSKNAEWYEGAALTFPSTNNGLEATNAWLKRAQTFGERLPVGQFLNNMTDVARQWSERRNPESENCTDFSNEPRPTLKEWTAAYQWTL